MGDFNIFGALMGGQNVRAIQDQRLRERQVAAQESDAELNRKLAARGQRLDIERFRREREQEEYERRVAEEQKRYDRLRAEPLGTVKAGFELQLNQIKAAQEALEREREKKRLEDEILGLDFEARFIKAQLPDLFPEATAGDATGAATSSPAARVASDFVQRSLFNRLASALPTLGEALAQRGRQVDPSFLEELRPPEDQFYADERFYKDFLSASRALGGR